MFWTPATYVPRNRAFTFVPLNRPFSTKVCRVGFLHERHKQDIPAQLSHYQIPAQSVGVLVRAKKPQILVQNPSQRVRCLQDCHAGSNNTFVGVH